MLREDAERTHAEIVLRSRGEPRAFLGGVEPIVDPVMPELHAEGGLDRASVPFRMDMTDIAETGGRARILLFELISVGRVVERVGEVREEIQFVAEDVGLQAILGAAVTVTPVGRPGEIAGIAAVGRIHVPPTRQRARLDERERDLVARAPFALVET